MCGNGFARSALTDQGNSFSTVNVKRNLLDRMDNASRRFKIYG
jgi:hypothetical protein